LVQGAVLEIEVNREAPRDVFVGRRSFFDVFASPFLNRLPVMRDGLMEARPAHG
jgi:hypothetical protein